MRNKQSLYKNLACVSFCLFLFFMSSIFVSETYYNRIINQQIQELSLLKSVHFSQWGKMQAPSSVIHKFQPYTFDSEGKAELSSDSMKYQYTFEYKEYSFSQGNTGNIRYLNNWKRELITGDQPVKQSKLKVFNVDAETVYNYDYYAPTVRQFALTYNVLYDTLTSEFIPLFYAQYMYEYLFQNQTMVWTRVFQPMKMNQELANKIYTHQKYGLNKPEIISKWIQVGQAVEDQTYYEMPFYQGLIDQLKLTKNQVLYIAGPRSSMFGMLMAIKGALRYKLNKMDDTKCSDDYCSNEELMAAQMGTGFLTKQTVFASTAIGKSIHQLNTTLFNSLQYSTFCDSRPDLKKCSGDQNTAAITFFSQNFLSNYKEVAYIFSNFQNPESIEVAYDIPGEGQAIIEYVKFLFSHTFNLPQNQVMEEKIQEISIKQSQQEKSHQAKSTERTQKVSQTSNINVQAFKRSFTNYNHIQQILDHFQNTLFVELHTRAFFTKHINITQKPKCEDYYTEDFEPSKDDCSLLPLTTLDDVRVYMKAFLGVDTEAFMNATTLSKEMAYDFFHKEGKSLFAQQAIALSTAMAKQFSCSFEKLCTKEELIHKEWKDGQILKNLPIDYFSPSNQSITEWDYQNKLKGIQPQLYKFITVSPQLQPQKILNSQSTGIYSLFNLMKVYNNKQTSTYKGITNTDLLYYLQTIVMDIQFQGVFIELTMNEFFNSHYSEIVNQKRQVDPQLGGAPWLNPSVSVLKLSNEPQKFNSINSGIYDAQKLRSLSQIEGNSYSSSVYQVFKSEQDDVTVTYTSDKKIRGTNLFGFQTKIEQNGNIEGYFDMIYQSQTLNFKSKLAWKNENNQDIDAFRFGIDSTKSYEVNVEQLANKTVDLVFFLLNQNSESYFIVEPNTGLTLEMYIKYTVYSKPFYTEYLQKNTTSSFPLYQGEIYYKNEDTQPIVQISKDEQTLKVMFLMGIILSSLFVVIFIAMLILYRKARKGNKFGEQNKSLMSSETGSMAY